MGFKFLHLFQWPSWGCYLSSLRFSKQTFDAFIEWFKVCLDYKCEFYLLIMLLLMALVEIDFIPGYQNKLISDTHILTRFLVEESKALYTMFSLPFTHAFTHRWWWATTAAYHQQARQVKALAKSHDGGSRKLEELSQSSPHEAIQKKRDMCFLFLYQRVYQAGMIMLYCTYQIIKTLTLNEYKGIATEKAEEILRLSWF